MKQVEEHLRAHQCELKQNGITFDSIPDSVTDPQRYREWFAFMLLKLNERAGGAKPTVSMYNQTVEYISSISANDLENLHNKACGALISDVECVQKHKDDLNGYISVMKSKKRNANSDVVRFRQQFQRR